MEQYVEALQGISYRDWNNLRTAVDRAFEQQKSEFDKTLKLADTKIVSELIRSQFGRTLD